MFLTKDHRTENQFKICDLKLLQDSNEKMMLYRSAIRSESRVFSADEQTFVSLQRDFIKVFQSAPVPLWLTLRGHIAEVTCVDVDAPRRLLVSGSLDNTVRLWSLDTGQQLCLFHTYDAVLNVRFDRTSSYVITHCMASPQKGIGIILKIQNVANTWFESDDLTKHAI